MAIAERTMTLEEFLALPEEEPPLEFWDGVVRQKVSPQYQHGMLQFNFGKLLDGIVGPSGLGQVFTETRFRADRGSPVPDLSFYRRERIPLLPNGWVSNERLGPPDLAVEIVSPEQSVSQLIHKCLGYAASGVRVTLLVVPNDEMVFAFRPDAPLEALHGADRIDLDDVLPGFELTVTGLFDLLVPPWARSAEAPTQ